MAARLALAAAGLIWLAAGAAPAGLLYDPEPPPNSAYVRVINATPKAMAEVSVDGRARIRDLAANEASEYLVLPAGKRTLSIAGAGGPAASLAVDVVAGRAVTIAFAGAAKPWIFEDKANTNLAKAVLAIYHLNAGAGPVDVLAANGATKVVTGLAPGASQGLTVNPIKVDLSAVASGTGSPLASASVAMQPGGTYSLMLFPGARGELVAKSIQNKVERYAGK
jgi:alginate O-acetyltransferase complex protein AlgF